MTIAVQIKIMDWTGAREHARAVRYEVFVVEQNVPVELEWDEWDDASEHALALDQEGNPLGTARLLPDGHLGRMAVLKSYRRLGVGQALARTLIERARERRIGQIVLHAQTHAAGFYEKLGFKPFGAEFEEAGIPHIAMALGLSKI